MSEFNNITDKHQRSFRLLLEEETAEVSGVWYRAGRAAYTYLPAWQDFTQNVPRKFFEP